MLLSTDITSTYVCGVTVKDCIHKTSLKENKKQF
jgi:hypothetical protein